MARLLTTGWEIPNVWEAFQAHGGPLNYSWSTGQRSGNYCLRIQGSGSGGMPWRYHNLPAGHTELWLRFGLRSDKSNSDHVRIRSNTTDQLIRLQTGNGQPIQILVGGTARITSDFLYTANTWVLIELHLVLGDEGLVELRINGRDAGIWAGDTRPGSDAYWSRIDMGHANYGGNIYFDDWAVNTPDGTEDNNWCGDGHVVALRPNAAGDLSGWTPLAGENWENVDEVTPDNDASYVAASQEDAVDWYNLEAPTLPAGAVISRVWASALARKVDSEPPDAVQVGLRAEETDVWSADHVLSTDYEWYTGPEQLVNPDTLEAWSESDLGDLQVGIKAT